MASFIYRAGVFRRSVWDTYAYKIHATEEALRTPMDELALQAARRTPGYARTAVRVAFAIERRRARR
ncbi:MAG: hypothetical protein ACR2FE_02855 [Aeromicrobium sp.]